MKNRDSFSGYHPVVNFIYFGLTIGFIMFIMHPVCLVVSLISALTYSLYLNGRKAVRGYMMYMLPMAVAAATVNPAFNHRGATILAYLPTGNPLTLESICYGAAAAAMICAVIVFFACYAEVMTSDKFIYLFGRIMPSLSLVLSMTLRFVPKFKRRLEQVREAQMCIEGVEGIKSKGIFKRMRSAVRVFSIMVTWSLEESVEVAAAMKGRGYGLEGRSAFSIYSFEKRDYIAIVWLAVCGLCILNGAAAGMLKWSYYPLMQGRMKEGITIALLVLYALMCMTPIIINLWEDRRWKYLQSKI